MTVPDPTTDDVAALAEALCTSGTCTYEPAHACTDHAEAILASRWLAERDTRVRAEAAAEADRPAQCRMFHREPFDFAHCETHDTTFPLGGKCEWDGVESITEHLQAKVDEQRGRAVIAEMRAERAEDRLAEIERDATPAPVLSGGQADGEGWYEFLKPVVSTTHIAYVHEDGSVYCPESDVVDEGDFHVAQSSGRCWRLFREAALAARPVLSREELRERMNGHRIYRLVAGNIVCECRRYRIDGGWFTRHEYLDHLADVLAGEASH